VGIAPLMYSRRRFKFVNVGLIEFVATGLSDYGDFILVKDEKKCIDLIFDFLERVPLKWDLIDLRHIPEESITASLIEEVARERNYTLINRKTTCYYIPLNRTWKEYFKQLSKNRRYQLRKMEKRLNDAFSVCIKLPEKTEHISSFVDAFFNLYSKWLMKREQLSSLFGVPLPAFKEFLVDVASKFFEKRWLDVSVVSLNQKLVSAHFDFVYNKSYYYYMAGWDSAYSDYGVGNAHLMHLIRRSIDLGLERFDFLRGDESYKIMWNTSRRHNVRVILTKGLKGKLFKMFLNLRAR
jgi:CelD/BcsL family acetyltransferase involved in cellulose biosynthesis